MYVNKTSAAILAAMVVVAVVLISAQSARSVYSSPVSVVNPNSQPVPVQESGPFQPASIRLSVNETSGNTFWTVDGPTVPAGQRLVVEDVSVFGLIPSNSLLSGVWVVNKGGVNFLLVNPQAGDRSVSSDATLSIYGYNRAVKTYFNAGDVVEVQLFRDVVSPPGVPANGFNLINIYVHGYYANVP